MKLSEIRAAIKAKNEALNIVSPVHLETNRPKVDKSASENSSQTSLPESTQPTKKPSSKRDSKSSTSTINPPDEGIDSIVGKYLKPQLDYAVIPHTSKPTLLKGGAEKLASVFGSCNSSESKFLKQPFANRINTVLKISKKRAYVDAILTATCASSVFTQDMEDISNFQDSVK